jgi:hypothetical protein
LPGHRGERADADRLLDWLAGLQDKTLLALPKAKVETLKSIWPTWARTRATCFQNAASSPERYVRPSTRTSP